MIKKEVYEANDGVVFSTAEEALKHEGKVPCSKCYGHGTVSEKYNSYPSNLPDSGFVEKWAYRDIKCDECNGMGYQS